MFKIDKNVPLPEGLNKNGLPISPYRILAEKMEVGDSIGDLSEKKVAVIQRYLNKVYKEEKGINEKVSLCRKQKDGKFRLWRIA